LGPAEAGWRNDIRDDDFASPIGLNPAYRAPANVGKPESAIVPARRLGEYRVVNQHIHRFSLAHLLTRKRGRVENSIDLSNAAYQCLDILRVAGSPDSAAVELC
jgi:hypothetical protein